MHTSFLFLLFFFKYSLFFKTHCRVIFCLFSTGPALTRAAAPAAWDPATAGRHVETGPRRVDQVEHSAKHQRGAVGESIAGLVTGRRGCHQRLGVCLSDCTARPRRARGLPHAPDRASRRSTGILGKRLRAGRGTVCVWIPAPWLQGLGPVTQNADRTSMSSSAKRGQQQPIRKGQ